jgi:U3 small nucleolar RNA-associated protein 14
MKNLYEVFDDFEAAKTKKEKMDVIGKNLNATLVEVLKLTYHPNYQWMVTELPNNYKIPQDVLPGITHDTLNNQLRRIYIVQKGNETAEKLTPKRRNELLIQMLESLEPREAEIIAGILRKDQGVEGLTYKFVKEAFPDMLP